MNSQTKARGSYMKWTDEENNELLQLLVDAVHQGCRGKDGSISKTTIEVSIVPALNAKCNGKDVFCKLCRILREKSLLFNTRYISVEEMLAMFLRTVGQNNSYSVTRERFKRSKWTASVNFNKVLKALTLLSPELMAAPPTTTPTQVLTDSRYYPYFQNCVGAIDGTYIPAMVPVTDSIAYRNRRGTIAQNVVTDSIAYRNRRGTIAQNVLAACTFDLQFIYVLSGWEGSANDARVLNCALTRTGGLPLPRGKFYLADAGYPNRPQFLTPFRGVRYHLREFGNGRRPQNGKELFNHRHSCLRTAIERIFGGFKSRFKIFKTAPPFPFKSQARMVLACAGLHNYLRRECSSDEFYSDDDDEDEDDDIDEESDEDDENQTQDQQRQQANEWRDNIATVMWNDTRT